MDRILVVGNGGSGKSWLADRLAERLRLPSVHLDYLHWLPNFAGERSRDERDRLVAESASGEAWVMEGIYGSVLKQVLAHALTLAGTTNGTAKGGAVLLRDLKRLVGKIASRVNLRHFRERLTAIGTAMPEAVGPLADQEADSGGGTACCQGDSPMPGARSLTDHKI